MTTTRDKVDLIKVRKELKGKTLRLYLYLTKRSSGYTIDEMKYFGGFSNKALINQCLADMKRLGIVEKQGERYYVPRLIANAVDFAFKHYAKIGSKILPRGFVSTIAYAVFLALYFVFIPAALPLLPIGLLIAIAFIGLGIYEVYKMRSWIKKLKSLE
ncbi:MAG: hypothetical protein ACXQTI_10225 [Candidatus Nezhaarchaeales archaeon]